MVNRRGLQEWLVQRITAVLIGIYGISLLIFTFFHSSIDYFSWYLLFTHPLMKLATLIVLVSILWHAWIGLWTVLTDYVKNRWIRRSLEIIIIALLVFYFVELVFVLW